MMAVWQFSSWAAMEPSSSGREGGERTQPWQTDIRQALAGDRWIVHTSHLISSHLISSHLISAHKIDAVARRGMLLQQGNRLSSRVLVQRNPRKQNVPDVIAGISTPKDFSERSSNLGFTILSACQDVSAFDAIFCSLAQ